MDDMAICVCSCDAYSDVWPIFFRFLKSSWSECPYPIYLNTEKKNYSDTYYKVQTINCDVSCSWSKRLILCLEKIESERVLIILDDFFLLSKVDEEAIKKCLHDMKNDLNIASCNFRGKEEIGETESKEYIGFKRRKPQNTFWVNYLPGIWNKKALLYLLSPYEDPWQSEIYGTQRAKLSKWDFYESIPNNKIMDFNFDPNRGYGIVHGKWTQNTEELFKRNGISIDMNERGIIKGMYDYNSENIVVPKKTLKHILQYLAHGGMSTGCYYYGKKKIDLKDYCSIAKNNPRLLIHILINKIIFLFSSKNYILD